MHMCFFFTVSVSVSVSSVKAEDAPVWRVVTELGELLEGAHREITKGSSPN